MEVSLKIRKLRDIKGYSRKYMADALKMSERGYGKIENGEVHISIKKLELICEVLQITEKDFIAFDHNAISTETTSDMIQALLIKAYTDKQNNNFF
jgi:transcriptional regulator with XRE-family HTH domain